jgi:acyl carrier protein
LIEEAELAAFIADQFSLDPSVVTPEIPLFSSSLLDSSSLVNVVAFLEDKTGIQVEADEITLENFDSIRAILAFCARRLA